MYYFLIPLSLGFISNLASAFTTIYSEKWGKECGTIITMLLRNAFGIPVWAFGYVLAVWETKDLLLQVSTLSQIIGWLIISIGGMVIIIALFTIKVKAAAPTTEDNLVRTGIYSLVRHPIHCGMVLEFTGLFVLWPSVTVGIASFIGFIWIYMQSRFEEKDLIRRIPDYKDYQKRVPRFIPNFKSMSYFINSGNP